MKSGGLIAPMLAARRSIRRSKPDLLDWSGGLWHEWLRTQRDPRPRLAPRGVVCASLTCLDDRFIHIGLMQFLSTSKVECTVVLSFPTPAMARLARAQAQREGWQAFVHIISSDECDEVLQRLPGSDLLVVFRAPSILTPEAVELIASPNSSLDDGFEGSITPEREFFLGYARNYDAWFATVSISNDFDGANVWEPILSIEPATLQTPIALDPKDSKSYSKRTPWRGILHPAEGRIEIPDAGVESELVVTSIPETGAATVLLRQRLGLSPSDQSLRFRLAASLCTTTPREIRVETSTLDGSKSSIDLKFHIPPARIKPWMVSAFLNRGGAGNPVVRAFAKGLGCRLAYAEDEPDRLRDIPVVWGVLRDSDRILAQARTQDLYFFYIDHAYFNRGHGKTYRITRNAYEAGAVRECPEDRLEKLGLEVRPWRPAGRDIIVCPPTDYFMKAHDCGDWLETTLASLRQVTDRPIVVRKKPKAGEDIAPLQAALETAHALVTHSSNVAIEAACFGTPVFVSPASAAAPIGSTDITRIDTPVYPERRPWLAHLAYSQFSFDEIEDGRAWRLLLDLEERDLV
jgi:hypothetical protein